MVSPLAGGVPLAHRCRGRNALFQVERTVYDEGWDLFGYAGWSPRLRAMVVAFRGTDSHSIYNWAENMRYWRTDFKVPFPGADGSKVHTGAPPALILVPPVIFYTLWRAPPCTIMGF